MKFVTLFNNVTIHMTKIRLTKEEEIQEYMDKELKIPHDDPNYTFVRKTLHDIYDKGYDAGVDDGYKTAMELDDLFNTE